MSVYSSSGADLICLVFDALACHSDILKINFGYTHNPNTPIEGMHNHRYIKW